MPIDLSSFFSNAIAAPSIKWNTEEISVRRFSGDISDFDKLLACELFPRFQFSLRDSNSTYIGLGRCLTLAFNELKLWEENQFDGFLWGGLEFSSDQSSEWDEFDLNCFYLPRILAVKDDGEDSLYFFGEFEKSDLVFDRSPDSSNISFERLDNSENRESWNEITAKSLKSFDKDELSKIVLARRDLFKLTNNIGPDIIEKAKKKSNGNYLFYWEPLEKTVFFGVSPEKFLAGKNLELETESLAGTCRQDEDTKNMLYTEKNIREHEYVTNEIEKEFGKLSIEELQISDKEVLDIGYVKHLRTKIKGIRRPSVCWSDIIFQLHPTPAMGGVPKELAIKRIVEWESFSRGCYAAPLGFIWGNKAEFCVGIRSFLADDRKLHVYAGAGIVSGSSPDHEWDEINNKMNGIMAVIE